LYSNVTKINGFNYFFTYQINIYKINPTQNPTKKEVLNHVHLNHNTKKLLAAKKFFQNKIAVLEDTQKNLLFKKITVALQFDIKTIEKYLNGQDLFELIHSRGKLL
jgi:hypothetical protein